MTPKLMVSQCHWGKKNLLNTKFRNQEEDKSFTFTLKATEMSQVKLSTGIKTEAYRGRPATHYNTDKLGRRTE